MMNALVIICSIQLILFIYCIINNYNYTELKHRNELEIKDVIYETRERFINVENRVHELNTKRIDLEYNINKLECDTRYLKNKFDE